jgi:hypothetical protein
MGILAVVDTFIVYKISERRYGRNVAVIASILFAVMPMTWFLRRILLDTILMPFLLSSILFAIYANDSKSVTIRSLIVFLSGIFLGLAIFTKIPALTLIPLLAFLIYTNIDNRKLSVLGIWLIPVILIPLIWPAHAWYIGEFDNWLYGINYQSHRNIVKEGLQSVTGIGSVFEIILLLFKIDPVLMIVGLAGVFYTAIKRDFMFLLWIVPLLIFQYSIGFVQFFHLTPIIPALCIAAAKMIIDLSSKIGKNQVQQKIAKYFHTETFLLQKLDSRISKRHKEIISELFLPRLPIIIAFIIGIFGLISISLLITTDLNSSYLSVLAFIDKYLAYYNVHSNSFNKDLTIISDHRYLLIPQYIRHENFYYKRFWDSDPISTGKVLLILQNDFVKVFLTNTFPFGKVYIRGDALYNNTVQIAAFNSKSAGVYNVNIYPYTSFSVNQVITPSIEIRTNVLLSNTSTPILPINNGTRTNEINEVNHTLETNFPTNQIKLPLFWIDPSKNCDNNFKCTGSLDTGWNDKSSLEISTNSTNKDVWSAILYNKQIDVNPGEQYQVVTHMNLNQYATQSHVALEGYNETSKSWYRLTTQCPSGTNGPLNWEEFTCVITIPDNTSAIRPVLNAGWSSEEGKEAVTLFDNMNINKTHSTKISSSK